MKLSFYHWLYIVNISYLSINCMESCSDTIKAPYSIKKEYRESKKRRAEEQRKLYSENIGRSARRKLDFGAENNIPSQDDIALLATILEMHIVNTQEKK